MPSGSKGDARVISGIFGPARQAHSARLDALANERAKARTPRAPMQFGGTTVPEEVRAAPPSIWAKPSTKSAAAAGAGVDANEFSSDMQFRKLIAKYDTDNDGCIDERELRELLIELFHLGVATTQLDGVSVVHTMMDALDRDSSGKISTDELVRAWQTWLGQALMPVRCLLIIDVQNDFISGTLAVNEAEAVVPVINEMRRTLPFDAVAYSLDWHPHTHCSFYETFAEGPDVRPSAVHSDCDEAELEEVARAGMFTEVTMTDPAGHKMRQMLWPRHCTQGSWGAKCHADLALAPGDLEVLKGTDACIDSYSAFYDNGKLKSTGLTQQLRNRKVTHVYVVGIALDFCVRFSAAAEEGFITTVVEDACRGVAPASTAEARRMLTEAGVRMCTSQELPALMQADTLHEALSAARSVSSAVAVAERTITLRGH
eukprot:CAMPEP_0115865112 /NCGR_PEP_ID=MMETSP0287-20121206/19551_1 /TAXON_ID=412157 /ORGANISM="Chrysochromulina rotalis, Strain UIO044" /LENGTH=429 /DNA_ID=CAMNT_0003319609 /DNA_START=54 /DNA_END=1344 /DNA_ORIENTATION=+